MSKTQYYCAASLDGYIAEADDSLSWLLDYEGSFEGDGVELGPLGEGGAYEHFYGGVDQITRQGGVLFFTPCESRLRVRGAA